jgi:hypothetical protein
MPSNAHFVKDLPMYLRDSNDAFSPHYGGRKSFMTQGIRLRFDHPS